MNKEKFPYILKISIELLVKSNTYDVYQKLKEKVGHGKLLNDINEDFRILSVNHEFEEND